jgi:TetR/AcrR family transcriptional regulator, cholesterol catabolism regulator
VTERRQDAIAAARAATRARLLASGRALFAERGFAACRIADVARGAGMSPGNVYWHFDSKEELLAAILAEGFAVREAMIAAVADEYGPARRKLEILVERTIDLYDEQAEFFAVLAGLAGPGGRELVASLGFDLQEIERRSRANVRRVLAEARSEGAVAPADPDLLVTFWFALFNGLLLAPDEREPPPRDALRDVALRLLGHRPAG